MNKERNSVLSRMGYSCGDICGGGGFLICNLLIFNFFVIVQGLSVVQASTIIFVCKLWDGITDPLMGFISDHTRSRFGRRRIYFLIGAPLMMISFALLWNSFGIRGGSPLMAYHLLTYMLFDTIFTMVMVPYNTILSDMTSDYNERTRYTSMRMVFSATAALVCAVLPSILINSLGGAINGPAQKIGYAVMGVVFGGFFLIVWLLTFFGTWENPLFTRDKPRIGFRDWIDMFRNKTFRSFLGIFIFVQVSIDLMLALFVFFVDIVLMKYQYYALVMGILLVFQILYMALAGKVAGKKGKRFPLFVAMPIWAVTCIVFFFFTQDTPLWLLCMMSVFVAIGPASGNICTWSMLSDLFDVGELMSGKRLEGLYSGVTTFIYKCSSGLAILIIGIGLQFAGFNQDEYNYLKTLEMVDYSAYNSSPVVGAIKGMIVFIPLVFQALVVFFALRYKLNDNRFNIVKNAIERFKAHGLEAVFSDNEKADLETITGHKTEKLWGCLHTS
jgi:oligogalacturonide transporter